MRFRASLILWACLGLALTAAAWDAPNTPNQFIGFFAPGDRFYLETFADGYQAVHLDPVTEEALRRERNRPDFDEHVHQVLRRGSDFIHFRTASGETDVIVHIATIKRVAYRVDKRFD